MLSLEGNTLLHYLMCVCVCGSFDHVILGWAYDKIALFLKQVLQIPYTSCKYTQ